MCPTCTQEKGPHPHVRWGGQQHYHADKHGNKKYCSEDHAYCLRLDCGCGAHGNVETALQHLGLLERRGGRRE